MNPGNAVAAHSVTHSYFEYGDAATGGNFLGNWLEGFDPRAHYHTHLSWHQALFELALGRYGEALQLYEDWIRPTAINKNISGLSDSASFMWRMTIYGGEAPPKPWDEVKEQAAPARHHARARHSAMPMPPWPSRPVETGSSWTR